jgi:TolA-binding protein
MSTMHPWRRFATTCLLAGSTIVSAQQATDEEQARRQLESGRSFARQGNYTEALRDFRVVADTYSSTTVADNALLEIARYYLDIVGDTKETATAVETILKKYPTSDSAPDAYLITGRLAMSKSHQAGDLDTALANFDRVSRLFPSADAVPRSLVLAGEALWYAGRFDDALASLVRVEVEYPSDPITAQAHLNAARVMVSRGDPTGAMEELQQIRNRWPASPEAELALGRLTILHRLHVRARAGAAAYAMTGETPGPPKLQNVVGLSATPKGAIYWAAESGFGLLTSQKAPAPPTGSKPRGLTMDNAGNLVSIEPTGLRPSTGTPLALTFPRQNGTAVPLEKIDTAVQLSNGDWLVMDDDAKGIQRYSRTGEYMNVFSPTRVSRLAVNALDEIAGLDREQKGVVFFDIAGKVTGRIPAKGAGFEFGNIEDLAYDAFGYLYVLDRATLAVFSPYGAVAAGAATAPPAATGRATPPGRTDTYKLLTAYTESDKSPSAFRRATAFALDLSGGVYLYDDKIERVRVYR